MKKLSLFLSLITFSIFNLMISLAYGQTEVGSATEALKLRQFIYDVISSSGKQDPNEKVLALKEALVENGEILKWIVEGKNIQKIMVEADLNQFFPNDQFPLSTLVEFQQSFVENYNKVLLMKDTLAQGKDLKSLTSTLVINKLIELNPLLNKAMLLTLGKKALIGLLLIETKNHLQNNISSLDKKQLRSILDLIPNGLYFQMANKINSSITNLKFSDSPAIKMIQDPKTGFDLSSAPQSIQLLFEKVLSGYFDRLGVNEKRKIILDLLKLPPFSSDIKKLSSILNNAGPTLQKLFQLIGKDVKSPMVAEVMNELKSNIKPFSQEEARQVIEAAHGKKLDELFSDFKYTPLAAASVGQVHLAKLKGSNREVIVKIMRPGIEEKAKREIEILKGLAPDSGTRKIIEGLEESLMEELNFHQEAKNLEEGKKYDKPEKGIVSVKLVSEIPVKKNVLVMEKAPGKPMEKYNQDYVKKGKALGKFLEMWFDESMFKSGFFHGDLHSGNIFFKEFESVEEAQETLPDLQDTDLLTVIDFGNASTLSAAEKKAILNLALGSIFQSPATAIRGISAFHQMTKEEHEVFSKTVKEILSDEKITTPQAMNAILNKAIEMNFRVPKNLILFNRGRLFLEKQIMEANKNLVYEAITEDLPEVDIDTIYRNIFIKRVSSKFVKKFIFSKDYNEKDSILDKETISHLIDDYFYPAAKYYKKKISFCVKKVLYDLSLLYLEQVMNFTNFYFGY